MDMTEPRLLDAVLRDIAASMDRISKDPALKLYEVCPLCQGAGRFADAPCSHCRGKGRVRSFGERTP